MASLYTVSTGAKQRCSLDRGERALSIQDVVSLGIVQPILDGAEHMHSMCLHFMIALTLPWFRVCVAVMYPMLSCIRARGAVLCRHPVVPPGLTPAVEPPRPRPSPVPSYDRARGVVECLRVVVPPRLRHRGVSPAKERPRPRQCFVSPAVMQPRLRRREWPCAVEQPRPRR